MRTLDRMLEENNPNEVVANIGENRELLTNSQILVYEGGEYRVELKKDDWRVPNGTRDRIDSALYDAMDYNEVTWCGSPQNGHVFTEAYVEGFNGAFETADEYYASINDYVDCGTGEP